jgi:hypothetical protein
MKPLSIINHAFAIAELEQDQNQPRARGVSNTRNQRHSLVSHLQMCSHMLRRADLNSDQDAPCEILYAVGKATSLSFP